MGMSCSYFNIAFLMPAFNPEGKKFLGGEGGNRARELKEIGAKNFPPHCDAEDKFGLLTCATDILVK